MSKFTDYIDGFADKTSTLSKDELKERVVKRINAEVRCKCSRRTKMDEPNRKHITSTL